MGIGLGLGVGLRASVRRALDPAASAFLAAAGITDRTQRSAVNVLVGTLKTKSLWTPMVAGYPIVGGSESAHKINLKDPRDLDAAFRLSFGGGWTHNAAGMTGNGTTNYANTFFSPLVNQTATAGSFGVYCTGNTAARNGWEMGCNNPGSQSYLATRYGDGNAYYAFGDNTFAGQIASASGVGFAVCNRNGGVSEYWKNGTKIQEVTIAAVMEGNTFYLGGLNDGGPVSQPSDRTLAFAFLSGSTLTTQNQTDLYAAVLAYQTALGRA